MPVALVSSRSITPHCVVFTQSVNTMTDMELLSPPTPEVIKMVRESVGVDEKRIAEAKEQLRQWLEKQPHLPHCIDDKRLENIYLRSKGSIERAKSALDLYYTVRTALPQYFAHRDIAEPWSYITKVMYFFPLPKLTDDGCRVAIAGVIDPDPEKYNITLAFKKEFMTLDLLLLEDYAVGDIIVVDCTNFKMHHAASLTPTAVRHAMTTILHGFSSRLKAIHLANAPPYMVPVVNLVRSVVKPKIAKRIFVDAEGFGTLHKMVSPEILPYEYQGQAGSVKDMWDAWVKKLHCYRNWFLEEEKYKADESKRPEQLPNRFNLFGSDGSFRQLNID